MSLLRFVLITFVVLSGLISPNALSQDESSQFANLPAAPAWKLKHSETVVSSEFLAGKPYVLHFWATWCPYCKRLQPGLEKVAVDFNEQNISTYAVSFWENPDANPQREMNSRGLNLTVLSHGDDVAKAFSVQGTPTTVFINHKGEVLARLTTSNPNDPQIRMAYKVLEDEYKKSLEVASNY